MYRSANAIWVSLTETEKGNTPLPKPSSRMGQWTRSWANSSSAQGLSRGLEVVEGGADLASRHVPESHTVPDIRHSGCPHSESRMSAYI